MPRPPVLIEEWLPIEAIGAESKRERGASSALPPLYFLHVWWARRPLTTSRAAILAGVLPQWSADWPETLAERFPDKGSYQQWFLQLCGIFGDPVEARKKLDWAKSQGISIPNPYTHARAFTVNPTAEDLALLGDLLEWTWGSRELSVLDPFAGGGSIPFEALRYGFTTIANDLNPVAAVILKATLDYPARFGPGLADDIRSWGQRWYELVKPKLQPFFTPLPPGAEGAAYLWARTVACPTTGKPVPLSPNWWLRKGSDPVAVQLIAQPGMDAPGFAIVTGKAVRAAKPDEGTISRGVGRSPWTGEPIDGDYIKAEAQAGRMGQMLYAVATKVRGGFEFRAPTDDDLAAVARAEAELARRRPGWLAKGIIPSEAFPSGNDNRPITYGMPTWADFFSPRQLLSIGTFLEELLAIEREISQDLGKQKGEAVYHCLALALDICADYNNIFSTWEVSRQVVKHIFARHDFSMTWSFGEFDGAANLLPWARYQVFDAYRKLTKLAIPLQYSLAEQSDTQRSIDLSVTNGSANHLSKYQNGSIQNITVDPPYYDNVQYAELSDFFYVWLKRSVGHLFPDFFQDELTNKDDEAVANPARFEAMGRKKKQLAEEDYQRKMAAAFGEMHRVLRDDGVLTVMFTHKRIEAWDTLASALIGAGFTIQASWPVHTESEHSLHQAQKNAAASTILLVCRKREEASIHESAQIDTNQEQEKIRADSWQFVDQNAPVWWEDIQGEVRRTARQKASDYLAQGIRGVDLYISTFGPTLSIISQRWPVLTGEIDPKSGQPAPLRPETALDLARQEVIRLRKEGLLEGRNVQFDPVTDWALMAWDAFQAEQFPYDEARKLAIALGLELDSFLMSSKRLVAKKGQFVVIQQPSQRRGKGRVDPEALIFEDWIDAAHTAMLVYAEDGPGACDLFLRRAGLKRDTTFIAVLQALLHAVPRTRLKGEFARPEAAVLENLRLAFYADDIPLPVEVEPVNLAEQLGFGALAGGDEFEGEQEEGEEDEES